MVRFRVSIDHTPFHNKIRLTESTQTESSIDKGKGILAMIRHRNGRLPFPIDAKTFLVCPFKVTIEIVEKLGNYNTNSLINEWKGWK